MDNSREHPREGPQENGKIGNKTALLKYDKERIHDNQGTVSKVHDKAGQGTQQFPQIL